MDKASQNAIDVAAVQAYEEAIPWHTVGIIARSEAAVPQQGIGTGAAVEWNRHFIILTAKHVIADTPRDELRFFLRPGGTLESANVKEVDPNTIGVESRRCLPIRSLTLSDVEDIALIELDATATSIDNLRFHVLERNTATPPPGETVTVAGYPSDCGHVVAAGAMAVFLTCKQHSSNSRVTFKSTILQPTF